MNVSIVTPVYNSARFIEATLDSLANQTCSEFELLLIDDGSTDSTVDVIQRRLACDDIYFDWKLLKMAHNGPGACRNRGIIESSCDWVAFLDSDDLWDETKIEVLNYLISRNTLSNFYYHDEVIVRDGKKIGKTCSFPDKKKGIDLERDLYLKNRFSTSSVCVKKDVLFAAGLFDKSLSSAQDYDLWIRLCPLVIGEYVENLEGIYSVRYDNVTNRNFGKRFRNEIIIANKYRNKFGLTLYLLKIARIILGFSIQICRRIVWQFFRD